MAKKISYNTMSKEELILELTKHKSTLRGFSIEKAKTGHAKEYRATRKTVARIMTAINAPKA